MSIVARLTDREGRQLSLDGGWRWRGLSPAQKTALLRAVGPQSEFSAAYTRDQYVRDAARVLNAVVDEASFVGCNGPTNRVY